MVRIATFNVENLFARYKFRKKIKACKKDGFSINDVAFDKSKPQARKLTGKAIKATNADIVCLQEVESLDVLDSFNAKYLAKEGYKHRIVIDSHDPRRIDVAVLSRYPITRINTHRHERTKKGKAWLFSRDCLEVDVDVRGKNLRLYVNHLKSMSQGRGQTKKRRKIQADRVAKIIDETWAPKRYKGNFIVVGDMNDYPDRYSALSNLLNHPQLVNVVDRLPEEERWTHYWAKEDVYSQLDYLLISKTLADHNPRKKPVIERRGMPKRAKQAKIRRFNGVGLNEPKASDHCPLYIDLKLT